MKAPQLNHAPFDLAGRRTVLLADGEFSTFGAKTAVCYLRYRTSDVIAIVDSTQAGATANEAVGFGGDIPVVATVDDAPDPEVAIIGIAPQGGRLDERLRRHVLACVERGIDVVSGLHDFLADDAEITAAALASGARIWDVRRVAPGYGVSTGRGCTTGARTVLVVGSDCNVGKMTATVELYNEACARDLNVSWAATGQTGMMLRGSGIAVDRVIADFIGGASEALVNYEGAGRDIVFVEGQGALVHPGYAGVTLGLLFGVMPDCMVMAHAPKSGTIGDTAFAMPPLAQMIDGYEAALRPFKMSRVVAIALNTAGFDDGAAHDMMNRTAQETGLPVADPVRVGAKVILDAVLDELEGPNGRKA